MTNISTLPQFKGAMIVVTNADWRDPIQFVWAAETPNAGQPIDLTGITFYSQFRATATDTAVLLDMSTTNGLMVTNPQLGTLAFAVPRDQPANGPPGCMSDLDVESGIIDILATGDNQIINLCQVSGGIPITVNSGVTRGP